jgi:uncharacterized surface protein with fasciclin (FAS1) repeats
MIDIINFNEILNGKGPFTVLVPNDEAFDQLPDEVFEEILNKKGKIADILSNHVLVGKFTANDIRSMDEVKTLDNNNIVVELHNEGLIIGGSKVIEPNIECENGMIHIIDVVLMPA